MIQRKKKLCIECNKEAYIFSRGRCKVCATKEYSKKRLRNSYTPFFKSIIPKLKNIDVETKEIIPVLSSFNCCHIFPKRIYKSVSEDIDNIIVLTLYNHTRLDNMLSEMDFEKLEKEMPNTYNKIIQRAEILLPRITERGNMYWAIEKIIRNK